MTTRINGFSGMDVDGLVKSMMKERRVPLDKLNQQKTTLEWTRDSYRELNSKVLALGNKLKSYNLSSSMNSFSSTVSGNTDAIKVVATSTASKAPMTVSVGSLASQAVLDTGGAGFGLTASSTLKAVQDLTKQMPDANGKYNLYINNETFSFDVNTTISQVISQINSNPKANATAKFDEITGKLTILSKDYGDKGTISVNQDSNLLSLFKGTSVDSDGKNLKVVGQKAQVVINGTNLSFDSNNFTLNGVQITLLATTAADKPATITTATDTSKAFDTIKSFINDYNEFINTLVSKAGEERYRDYVPLTDEQKSTMKDTEIKAWEERAKSGLLKNDNIITSTVNSMRMIVSKSIGQLSAIGITTGQYNENGKLYLNEDKLKAALENDPQSVITLFQGSASSSTTGLFNSFKSTLDDTITKFSDKAGTSKFDGSLTAAFKSESSMGRQLKDYVSRISDTQYRLKDVENRYYRQFSAMEQAIAKLQSQSSSLFGEASQSS